MRTKFFVGLLLVTAFAGGTFAAVVVEKTCVAPKSTARVSVAVLEAGVVTTPETLTTSLEPTCPGCRKFGGSEYLSAPESRLVSVVELLSAVPAFSSPETTSGWFHCVYTVDHPLF